MTFCILIVLMSALAVQSHTTAQANACSKALAPHLKKGDQVQVTKPSSKDFPGAFLKPDATHAGPVMRYLPMGTVVEVVDGPKCGEDKGYWYQVKVGDLTGWLAEAADNAYALEPATAPGAKPLPSTIAKVLTCIQPVAPAQPAIGGTSDSSGDNAKVLRILFSTEDGHLQVSENGGLGRVLATFDPPPLSVDLSPNGMAALVVTYNGLYWVDAVKGTTVMIADAVTFGLTEGSWPDQVTWLPDGKTAALELVNRRDNVTGYAVWNVALDGSHTPFRVDTGSQGPGGIKRSPSGTQLVMFSANDIALFPRDLNDQSPSLLEYVPKGSDADPNVFIIPAMSWAANGNGFYTFIPLSEVSGPDEKVGGHLWYVPTDASPKDLGKLTKVKATDYVIPSPSGDAVLLGRGAGWAIQNAKSGTILQTLPAVQFVFSWTPDGKGVVFTNKNAEAKYLGIDGSTTSNFVPANTTDLYDINWLPDGTLFYLIRGKDGKLSFKVRQPGDQDKFLGIVSSVNAYSGWVVTANTAPVQAPSPCK